MNLLSTLFVIIMLTGFQHALSAQDSSRSAVKNNALVILQKKCNICHSITNRRTVFTENNIETHAGNIYKQVYIKRRMPKGGTVTLTQEEEAKLLLWLQEQGVVASGLTCQNGKKCSL